MAWQDTDDSAEAIIQQTFAAANRDLSALFRDQLPGRPVLEARLRGAVTQLERRFLYDLSRDFEPEKTTKIRIHDEGRLCEGWHLVELQFQLDGVEMQDLPLNLEVLEGTTCGELVEWTACLKGRLPLEVHVLQVRAGEEVGRLGEPRDVLRSGTYLVDLTARIGADLDDFLVVNNILERWSTHPEAPPLVEWLDKNFLRDPQMVLYAEMRSIVEVLNDYLFPTGDGGLHITRGATQDSRQALVDELLLHLEEGFGAGGTEESLMTKLQLLRQHLGT